MPIRSALELFPPVGPGLALESLVFTVLVALVVVGATIAGAPRRTLVGLAGVTLAGAALRWVLAPATLMDMSNYEREPILFRWFAMAGLPLEAVFSDGWDRWQQILAVDFTVSVLLPLVVYAHARVCFADHRVSLLAAALFAFCPVPIYFARSDNLYVTSALLSSVTFVLLHAATSARHWLEGAVAGLAAVSLFVVTLSARQENFLFGGLALMPLLLVVRERRAGWWHRLLWPLVVLAFALQWFWDMAKWQAGGDSASVADTASYVFRVWTPDPLVHLVWTNNYVLKPWILPAGYAALAIAGLVVTWRTRRAAFVYVTWWFAIFYLGHGIIPAWDDTATARYGMHTIIPVTFAAAFGLAWALDSFRAWQPAEPKRRALALAGISLAVATTTWLGFGLFRQPESDVQQEYRFLRTLTARGLPEPGALVIESYGNYDRVWRDAEFFAIKTVNRFDYFGRRTRGGAPVQEIASARTFVPGHRGPVYLYLGLPCLWLRRERETSRPCEAALSWASWEKVASEPVTSRRHDNANGDDARGGEIALYRLAGPAPSVPPTPVDVQDLEGEVLLNPLRR